MEISFNAKVSSNIIAEGVWDDMPWQFVVDEVQPPIELCTAAFCVTEYQGKIVLVEHVARGWELPGGHINAGEDPIQTVIREVREEAGMIISNPQYFGHKKVSPTNKLPDSYIPYFVAHAQGTLNTPLASDVRSLRLVGWADAPRLVADNHAHELIIQYVFNRGLL